jgi:hypothetical protein
MEYQTDIYNHMLEVQQETSCDAHMIDLQPELEWHMRPFLLDFLVESHLGLQLNPETLFLAVNIIDRYASKRVIYKRHYQLVACSSLWIASKYQDKKSRIPTLQELNMLCCGAYENHMFVQMESHILSTLEWTVGRPTEDLFVDMYLSDYPEDPKTVKVIKNIALYVCELAMFHKSLLIFPSSVIASCASDLAGLIYNSISNYGCHNIFRCQSVSSTLPQSGSESQCMDLLANALLYPSACLQRKYTRPQFGGAYTLVANFLAMKAATAKSGMDSPVSVMTLNTPPSPQETISTPRYVPQMMAKTQVLQVHSLGHNPYYMTPPVSPGDVFV